MKPNTDKFIRSAMYGLPMHASTSPGHKFHVISGPQYLDFDEEQVDEWMNKWTYYEKKTIQQGSRKQLLKN